MNKTNKATQNENKLTATDSLSFLLTEYGQCYEHMRHYDETKLSLAEFAVSFYSIIATIVFAIVQYYPDKSNDISMYLGLFLFFISVAGFLIIAMLTKNRAYFVQVARQVNSLRKELMALNVFNFQNFLYTDTNTPVPYNPRSTHVLLLYFFSFVNAVFFSFGIFFTLSYLAFPSPPTKTIISLLAIFIVFILELFFIIGLLKEPKIGG